MKKIEEREAFASAFVGDWCFVVWGVESAIVNLLVLVCASERDGQNRETTVSSCEV